MRELTKTELTRVSGAVVNELFGITQIARGLTFGTVAGALAGSFTVGWQVGTAIYGSRGYQALLYKLH